jgi:hypothetical protein
MKKVFLLLTVLFSVVAVGFLFSDVVSASACDTDRFTEECVNEICGPGNVTCVPKTCQNSGSNTSSNCTEPACVPLCQDSLFDEVRADCLTYANQTGPWEQNRIVKIIEYFLICDGRVCLTDRILSITYYLAGNVCSTSDKCATNECGEGSPSITPLLNYGYCNCSAGSSYKVCCNQEGGSYIPTSAVADGPSVQDGIPPEEGVCPYTSRTVYCVGWTPSSANCSQGGPTCPVPPVVNLLLDGVNKTSVTIKPGESTDISWSASNARECYSSDINTGGDTSGSYTVRASDLTPREEPYTYEITCKQYYSEYAGGFRRDSIETSASKEVSVYVSGEEFGGCPDESIFDPADGSTLEIQDTGSSCIAYCSRCSNNPDQLGNMATWTDDNWSMSGGIICDDGWDDVTYEPNAICAFDVDINALPSSISEGDTTNISWSTDRASNCSISADPSDPTSPSITGSVLSGGSETVGPFNDEGNYEYTLSCAYSANPDVIKSDSVTVNVGSGGCTANLTANPSSITSGQSSNLSWSTSGTASCSINQGIGAVSTSGSRSVSPSSTTTYTLSCDAVGAGSCSDSATVSVGAGSCYSGPRSVSTNVSATRDCLPYHPNGNNPSPEVRQTTINWSGSVNNVCSSIIGGGSPSNRNISCSDSSSNWNFSRSGSSSISGSETDTPSSTQTYSASCTRDSYTCTDYNTFSSHDNDNDERCDNSCDSLKATYDAIVSCSCSRGSCVEDWPHTPNSSHCSEHDCGTTYEDCDTRCILWSLPNPITGARTCLEEEEYNCVERCNYDGDCIDWDCRYYAEDQTVRSGDVCSSSDSDSQLVRFIEEPGIPTNNLTTDPSKPQILLNQLINLIWNVSKPNSGTPTTLKCTPSISIGDDTGWVTSTGNMDRLNSSGEVKNLQPQTTTDYEITCRNRDNTDPLHCYQDSDTESYEVKVFEPYLEEKSPSFKDSFFNLIGSISEGLKKTLN